MPSSTGSDVDVEKRPSKSNRFANHSLGSVSPRSDWSVFLGSKPNRRILLLANMHDTKRYGKF